MLQPHYGIPESEAKCEINKVNFREIKRIQKWFLKSIRENKWAAGFAKRSVAVFLRNSCDTLGKKTANFNAILSLVASHSYSSPQTVCINSSWWPIFPLILIFFLCFFFAAALLRKNTSSDLRRKILLVLK